MSYRVPFVDPRSHYQFLKPEIDAAIIGCLTSGDLIYRKQLRDFESNLASFVGVKYAIGVGSGYDALHYSLRAAGIGPGDEVITVGHTFVATVSAIVNSGAMPVLIDVADDYNMKPELIEQALTPRTRALIPVHLNGRLCDMDAIMGIADEHGLIVIEDAAQSLGATFQSKMAGSFGRTGCFSFYPFKVLGGFGDGGAVTTNDPEIAQSISLLRYNGEDRETGEYHYHGYTGLLDNVQAAVLDVKLRKLPEWLEHRRRVAERYRNGFRGIAGLTVPHYRGEGFRDVYQNYVIRTPHRDALREYLKDRGIETLVHWSTPMWKHRGLKLPEQHLPNTESICREVVSLPMSAETTEDHVDITVDAIIQFFEKRQEERQE